MDREKISKEFKSENSNQFTSKGQIFQTFLAPFWKRLVAWLVDQALLALLIFVLLYLIAGNPENFIDLLSYSPILLVLADVLGNLSYFTILEGSTNQTLGKKLIKVIILDTKGEKVDYITAFLRRIGLVVPLFSIIDGAAILFTSKNQRFFDIIADTIVVNKKHHEAASKFLQNEEVEEYLKGDKQTKQAFEEEKEKKMLENLRKAKEKLKNRYDNGEMEEDQYLRLENKYKSRIKTLERRLRAGDEKD